MQRRRLLCLLGREPAVDDEPALVEAEVERREVEGQRAAEQREEAGVDEATRRLDSAGRGTSAKQAPATSIVRPVTRLM